MRLRTFHWRSLTFFWRSNLAVALGVAAGAATLTGALFVGDSIRASLRDLAIGRLGQIDQILTSPRFFRDPMADPAHPDAPFFMAPSILLDGSVGIADEDAVTHRVQVIGIGESDLQKLGANDWRFAADGAAPRAIANQVLADELSLKPGDEVLVRMTRPADVSRETLLGRRDQATATLRIAVGAIVPADGLASFTTRPRQYFSKNLFVPLDVLQRAIAQTGNINTLLATADHGSPDDSMLDWLRASLQLDDLGIQLRVDRKRGYAALESSSFLIEPPVEGTAKDVLADLGYPSAEVLTYLANSISRKSDDGRIFSIPYSTVSAVSGLERLPRKLTVVDARQGGFPAPGEIWLNQWASADLQANIGDKVTLEYYVTARLGGLETRSAEFTLSAVVALDDMATDPGFTPTFKGVTDTENLSDWDPPFPVDLKRVRDQDEAYWDEYRASPKALISLDDGRRIWAEQGERFGRLTSIRFSWPGADQGGFLPPAFASDFLKRLPLESLGLRPDSIRARLIKASEGGTDFGMLFVSFSFFLVVSSAMLVALLFRLSIERRARDIGLLLATGFSRSAVTRMMLVQGGWIAAAGTIMGLVGALGYARLMLAGLGSWWSAAVNASFLTLKVTASSIAVGCLISLLMAVVAMTTSIRGLTSKSPNALLAELLESPMSRKRRSPRLARWLFAVSLLAAVGLAMSASAGWIAATGAFFGAGFLALMASLALARIMLHRQSLTPIGSARLLGTARLALRQSGRMYTRSLLMIGLVAAASFIIAAMEALRLKADPSAGGKASGTGGYALIAESSAPLNFDMNSPDGRESLNIADDIAGLELHAQYFRLSAGDEASCLNLYRPQRPRILGAPLEARNRGGFAFAAALEGLPPTDNPWQLLDHKFTDAAIPAIGDEAAVRWQLKSGLGQDFSITDERGQQRTLRFVALLRGSILQSELIVSEESFLDLYPSSSGYSFFLIEAPADAIDTARTALTRGLSNYGLDVQTTAARLNNYLAVQNTYLGTFQSLGGLGLTLGTIGLAAVVLRNAWERRAEFGLMRAFGFPRLQLFWLIFAEHAWLVLGGLAAGTFSAALAILPQLIEHPAQVLGSSVWLTLALVLLTGVASTALAAIASLRAPLLASLRRE